MIYTPAFRRLAGVTQVVGPFEGQVVHNRLTHSLEVAQIARRLAEKLIHDNGRRAKELGGIDPDVAEAAALAHDLGHPPFGHAAEHRLDELAREWGAPDGFEGNAQSFRIVTRLAPHGRTYSGLDLTRATLNAILKYPRLRDLGNVDSRRFKKFGAYRDDLEAFAFARVGSEEDQRSVEAEIMDIADDIAYAVHDLDDFFRAGSIPLDSLRNGAADKGAIDRIFEDWTAPHEGAKVAQAKAHEDSIRRMLASLPVDGPYGGTFGERQELQWMTSTLIGDFIGAVTLSLTDGDNSILVEPQRLAQIHFLQQLVWGYVITNPRLKTQHARQRSVISDLFEIYRVAIDRKQLVLLPPTFRDEARALDRPNGRAQAEAVTRLAVDIVASLGDTQAIRIHQRLSGTALSSVSDLIDG